jgi:hypothetical protein
MDALANISAGMFENNRASIMIVNIAIGCLSFILLCVSMSGNSNTSSTIKNGAWTLGLSSSDNIVAWYGLQSAVGNDNGTTSYSDCKSATACSDCEDAGHTALNSTVFVFLFNLAMIVLSLLRKDGGGDSPVKKLVAVVLMSVSLLTMIIAMGAWNNQCVQNLPTDADLTYVLGPGMNCMLTTFLFSLFVFVSHLLTTGGGGSSMDAPINDRGLNTA